eukprot:TRINITY_DN82167_c0_g1_i1.p1 TRINITY_DN82167_c0_g1~~TRINITY_DN82167_c0_g1_i1.p1  ORF type:complete len:812 (-),score=209.74 TRINITY_DN82167_c0_g1_i1:160-2595(-)
MYSGPAASRGKSKKGKAAQDGARQDDVQVAATKKQLQKATKAQRKAGGVRRGGEYEVEEIGGMWDRGHEIEVASEASEESQSSGEDSDSGRSSEAPRRNGKFKPQSRSAGEDALANAAITDLDNEEDEEAREIKETLREQMLEWAMDPGMPEDEKKRQVRQLMAQWHPDKNRHIHTMATNVFQFIQAEVQRIVAVLSGDAQKVAKKAAEKSERKAQRAAEKSATASALKAARDEKAQKKKARGAEEGEQAGHLDDAVEGLEKPQGEEYALVVGHGPATTSYLRPWPRSHFTLAQTLVDVRHGEILMFGGEAYDGRDLTFYSDLYRLQLKGAEADAALPWEKLYSSVPFIKGPEARSSHQAFMWGKWMYIFGGEWSSRDQNRYRQFCDLWRFDVTGSVGTKWEPVEADGTPLARSGHRMAATSSGLAVLFGGFTEDKKRRVSYHDDLHVLQLAKPAWHQISNRASPRPGVRAGHCLWVDGESAYIFGGNRLKKKGSDQVDVMEDLWRLDVDLSAGGAARWTPLTAQGQGPGRRSGLCHCAVSSSMTDRRLFFGGVLDMKLPPSAGQSRKKREVALFHNDVYLLDCNAGSSPVWTRLWPAPGDGPSPALSLDASSLPADILAKGGGADVQTLALARISDGKDEPKPGAQTTAPRGRIAAGCLVLDGSLWLFGGSCESGPKQEVTLDDLWRLDLTMGIEKSDRSITARPDWECVLPLSERATIWFEDSDDSSSSEDEDAEKGQSKSDALAVREDRGGGVLSKKEQKAENHKRRMEFKREKQEEKCEEKLDKREAKREKQRQQALEKAAAKAAAR